MVTDVSADWEERMSALWASFDDDTDEEEFRARVDELAAELGPDHPVGLYERGGAWDSTDHSDVAVPLYQRALELGLGDGRRRQAVIQLASSLRNLGEAAQSVALLSAERDQGSDELDDAVDAFLALALVDNGREREAVSVALTALSRHMVRYRRSLANYAQLVKDEPTA